MQLMFFPRALQKWFQGVALKRLSTLACKHYFQGRGNRGWWQGQSHDYEASYPHTGVHLSRIPPQRGFWLTPSHQRERFTSSPTFLGGNTPATLG